MITKRILDFDCQLSRLFFIHLDNYDDRNFADGLYDYIFCHREGIQDNFLEIKKYAHTKTKIIVDISIESGNIESFLDYFKELTDSESYEFILIVDSDLSNYVKNVKINYKLIHSYSILFYAFTNIYSDSYTWIYPEKINLENGFMSFNGNLRDQRILLLLELLKNNISIDSCSFLFYTMDSNGIRSFNKNLFLERMGRFLHEKIITKSEYDLLKNLNLPKTYDVEFDNMSSFPHRIDSSYTRVVNFVTENTTGMVLGDVSKHDIVTFTEKTLKPFLATQIPLIYCTPNLNRELRKLGFDLFDDIIDYSFEYEVDHYKRLKLMVLELDKLIKMDLVDFRIKNFSRFYKNRMRVFELSNDGMDIIKKFILDEIY